LSILFVSINDRFYQLSVCLLLLLLLLLSSSSSSLSVSLLLRNKIKNIQGYRTSDYDMCTRNKDRDIKKTDKCWKQMR